MRDRFATWFVQSWIVGALLCIAGPIFLWSQLRIANAVGIRVRWHHLSGRVSINDSDETGWAAGEGDQDA